MNDITPEWLESVGFKKGLSEFVFKLRGLCVGFSESSKTVTLVMYQYEILSGPFTRERLCQLWYGLTGEDLR